MGSLPLAACCSRIFLVRGVVPLGMVITYLPSISAVTRRRLACTGAGLPVSASRRPQEGGKPGRSSDRWLKQQELAPKEHPGGEKHLLNPYRFGKRRDLGQKVPRGGRASAPSVLNALPPYPSSSSLPTLFFLARALPPYPHSSPPACWRR